MNRQPKRGRSRGHRGDLADQGQGDEAKLQNEDRKALEKTILRETPKWLKTHKSMGSGTERCGGFAQGGPARALVGKQRVQKRNVDPRKVAGRDGSSKVDRAQMDEKRRRGTTKRSANRIGLRGEEEMAAAKATTRGRGDQVPRPALTPGPIGAKGT